jgi:glycine cleavage system H protein
VVLIVEVLVKKYTSTHEWVEMSEDGKTGRCLASQITTLLTRVATMGITEYAANALGDVVFVELPEMGTEVKGPSTGNADPIGAVESVKSASDVYTPLSGKVIEVNSLLEEKPATINKSPEGDGWLAKLELSSSKEVEDLLTKEAYDALEKGEDH